MKSARVCFHEDDLDLALLRRSFAELLGTFLLVLAASAGGIAADRAFGVETGLVLPAVAIVIAGALVALIIALGSVSGGHFNPLITGLQWLSGERPGRCALAYVAAQLVGGLAGGWVGTALWDVRAGSGMAGGWEGFSSEALASAGLMIVVFGCSRSQRTESGPLAVGAWLMAAIIALPTTSLANPAVVLGAVASGGPIALGSAALMPFILAEVAGALAAGACLLVLFPGGLKSREHVQSPSKAAS